MSPDPVLVKTQGGAFSLPKVAIRVLLVDSWSQASSGFGAIFFSQLIQTSAVKYGMLPAISTRDWTADHAQHLLSRAGFGTDFTAATPAVTDGPDAWVEWLLNVPTKPGDENPPDWTQEPAATIEDLREMRSLSREEQQEKRRELRRINNQRLRNMKEWWLNRMLTTPHPLQEKLALFWHGHFVSSSEKVKDTSALWEQNQLFRYRGMGPFDDLTLAVGRGAAMLVYLDGARSTKAAANENYARELMELFTLGEGHYSEEDVKEVARAFTGWSVRPLRPTPRFSPSRHDDGEKVIFGKRGKFNDADVVKIILEHDAAAPYLCRKLWEFFAYKNPHPSIINALAVTLRAKDYSIKAVLAEMFKSQEFYTAQAMRTQIKSPIMWLTSLARVLDFQPFPTAIGVRMAALLGQDLFNPPSVKGWDGGRAWISTSTLILRNNFAHMMTFGGDPGKLGLGARRDQPAIPAGVLESLSPENKARLERLEQRGQRRIQLPSYLHNENLLATWKATSASERAAALSSAVFGGPIAPDSIKELKADSRISNDSTDPDTFREAIYALLSHPEFQLT